jgi:hypothetical protein
VPSGQSRVFDLFVPLLRFLEGKNPRKGLSLIAVAHKPLVHAQTAQHGAA